MLQTTAQQTVKASSVILADAATLAAKENKKILLMFSASWCGWCKKMDAAINDPSCQSFFKKNYVIVHLVVHESPEKKKLENPGSLAVLAKFKGEDSGIPFWVILDADQQLLADCYMRNKGQSKDQPGDNIGCPANEEEVNAFIKILKQTSSLTDDELAIIAKRFRENEL
jgi:thiol-disulfide isomerase/thioredoxin